MLWQTRERKNKKKTKEKLTLRVGQQEEKSCHNIALSVLSDYLNIHSNSIFNTEKLKLRCG